MPLHFRAEEHWEDDGADTRASALVSPKARLPFVSYGSATRRRITRLSRSTSLRRRPASSLRVHRPLCAGAEHEAPAHPDGVGKRVDLTDAGERR